MRKWIFLCLLSVVSGGTARAEVYPNQYVYPYACAANYECYVGDFSGPTGYVTAPGTYVGSSRSDAYYKCHRALERQVKESGTCPGYEISIRNLPPYY